MKTKLNLIWCLKTQYEVNFSFDWICNLFSQFEIVHTYDISNKFDIFLDNSIIIVCVGKDSNPKLCEYIETYNKKSFNYTVLHLSDEAFEQNIDFYKVSKKIIRNYYNQSYVQNYPILTVPLGYQTGISPKNVHKSLMVNFIGQIKSDRADMVKSFEVTQNKYFYFIRQWADPASLNVDQFSQVLSASFFTLCPRGWVCLDSFRINEALECNSIPVSILDYDGSDYFTKIYGSHPFIIGNNWQNSYEIMRNTDPIKKLVEVKSWWSDFKNDLTDKIKNYIN